MKILHVIPAVARRYGGPSAAVRGMAAELARRGHAVTVAAVDMDPRAGERGPAGDSRDEGSPVDYALFGATLRGEWKFSWPLTRWLAASVPGFDVVHVHGLFCYPSIPACRLARRSAVPYVVRPLGHLTPAALGRKPLRKRAYLGLIEAGHLRHAAAIHVTSERERQGLARLGLHDRARVIPLGLPAAPDPPTPNGSRDAGVFEILFLSRLHPVKGLPLLLGALARADDALPPWRLTVAGAAEDPGYADRLRSLAGELGLADRTEFVGHVSDPVRDDLLRHADLFVLPSAHESFGLAVAEALGAGVPVLVSPEVGIADEIAAADAGVVVEREPASLAAAIAALAADPARRARLARNARALARDRFTWRSSGDALESLYRDVVDGRR